VALKEVSTALRKCGSDSSLGVWTVIMQANSNGSRPLSYPAFGPTMKKTFRKWKISAACMTQICFPTTKEISD
jgi:hypothetical protein